MSRTFEDKQATREQVPLLVGLVGASGSGKTMSALRLATGIQRVSGGDIFFVDTEARRALYYADAFKFRHLEFQAPFGPLDYLAAIRHCLSKGAKTIIIDSMSHEHEGPGGVLEMHETEAQRLSAAWRTTLDKVKMAAWQKPKSERRALLNAMLQMSCNFILAFRAKEKMDLSGDKPKTMGWMPIAGEEFVYEMSLNVMLYPGGGGVPIWKTDEKGEKSIIKLPGQFATIFAKPSALCEEHGEQLARWAAGGVSAPTRQEATPTTPVERITDDEWEDVEARMSAAPDVESAKEIAGSYKPRMNDAQKRRAKALLENRA